MALSVDPVHIKYKKEIGKVNTNKVWEILTTGGLYMEILGKGAGFEVIGTGPHRGVARYIAEQRQPNLQWNEFAKGDYIDPIDFMFALPKYEAETDEYNRRLQERLRERD